MQTTFEERVINELIWIRRKLEEHDQRFDTMVTRDEFLQAIDGLTLGLERIEQEHTFSNATFQRHDGKLQKHDNEISDIKHHLKLV